jgi:hypothetical protein
MDTRWVELDAIRGQYCSAIGHWESLRHRDILQRARILMLENVVGWSLRRLTATKEIGRWS